MIGRTECEAKCNSLINELKLDRHTLGSIVNGDEFDLDLKNQHVSDLNENQQLRRGTKRKRSQATTVVSHRFVIQNPTLSLSVNQCVCMIVCVYSVLYVVLV